MAYEIKVALFSDDKICPCELSFCTSVYEIEVALFSAEWSTAFEKKLLFIQLSKVCHKK